MAGRARREGDLVTVTEKQDLQQAMAEVVEAAERSAPPGAARALPLQHLITATPLRLKLIPVASEARLRPRAPRPLLTGKARSLVPAGCLFTPLKAGWAKAPEEYSYDLRQNSMQGGCHAWESIQPVLAIVAQFILGCCTAKTAGAGRHARIRPLCCTCLYPNVPMGPERASA